MSAELAGEPSILATTAARGRRLDRRFFTGMSAVALLIVFAGFAPTYYLRARFGSPALAPLLHIHGIFFTSWILLFLTQTTLIAAKRADIHRRLGVAGAILAVLMPVVGWQSLSVPRGAE